MIQTIRDFMNCSVLTNKYTVLAQVRASFLNDWYTQINSIYKYSPVKEVTLVLSILHYIIQIYKTSAK